MFNVFKSSFFSSKFVRLAALILTGWLCLIPVVQAHHFMDGGTPTNFWQGFLSGLAHPIIGLDHFAFVVASGLIAVGNLTNIFIPFAFVIATIFGTIIHLNNVNLPIVEIVVSISVIISGIVLAVKNNPFIFNKIINLSLAILAGIAGIFHGYAYGEAIFGAENTPLFAYLFGFTIMQLIIAISAFIIGDFINIKLATQLKLITRFLGMAIATSGSVYLFNTIM